MMRTTGTLCRSLTMRSLTRSLPMIVLLALPGCASDQPGATADARTTAEVQLPESDPPVLTKAVADRIRTGMPQKEVLAILRDAGRDTPSAGTLLANAYTQGMLSTLHHELTIAQGKRKLMLTFKSATLTEKKVEGID